MTENQTRPRKKRKVSRYQRAQERRAAQKRADQKFYNTIFSVVGVCVLVVLGLAMLATSGEIQGGSTGSGAQELGMSRFLGLTALEWGGLALIGVIAVIMWRRITKR